MYPSAGVSHRPRDISYTDSGQEIGLLIDFYSGDIWAGSARFTHEDFEALAPADRPTDSEGNPLTELVLYPRETITLTFSGFTLIGIELEGWGDIKQGGGTIH
jgi:hypothetical protein